MKEVLKQVDEAFAFMHRTEPEVMHAFVKSLEAAEKPGSLQNAEGRIRTGGSLRKRTLNPSPLTWLGNLRNAGWH